MTELDDERMDAAMDRRLVAAGRGWLADQAPPPAVALDRLVAPVPGRPRWHVVAAAAAVALVVGGGTLALIRGTGGGASPSGHPSSRLTQSTGVGNAVVPWLATKAGHVKVGHRVHGHLVTPYDAVLASGHIGGTLHPGDTLRFTVTLESTARVSLHPCPNYSIAFGRRAHVTRRLNCGQVPYYASVPRPNGTMSDFRPTLPAQTPVSFQMQMRVPDEHGVQKVLWTLDGPESVPGFYGLVRVVPR